MTITNKVGDKGSPCLRTLHPIRNSSIEQSKKLEEIIKIMIQETNSGGNCIISRQLLKKDQKTESNAFLKSILRSILEGEFD